MRYLQATTKGDLARQKTSFHEEVKYSCGQCDHKATSKGSLGQHKREVHEGVNYHNNVTIWQLQWIVLLNTKNST